MLHFIDRDVTVRRVRSHWSLRSVSFLLPRASSSLINRQSQSEVTRCLKRLLQWEKKLIQYLAQQLNPSPCAQHVRKFHLSSISKSTWSNNFQQLQLSIRSITTVGKHQNPVTVTVRAVEYDTPGEHQWPNYPKTPNIISCLRASLVCLCSRIDVETDLWLLNLQVIKRQRVASWGTNSWLFTCWLMCQVSRDLFSLCSRQSMIPHDKLDCSSSESCWIILVLSIASLTPEIFLYCCLWAISLDSHHCRYSICSVTPKANEMC